jgi:hypothetical protein
MVFVWLPTIWLPTIWLPTRGPRHRNAGQGTGLREFH